MEYKVSMIIGIFAGTLFGIIISVFLASIIISSLGDVFKVENMNITVALNQTALEDVIRESERYNTPKTEPEINNFMFNGIYGWFCDDTSSYEPAISDLTQSYIDRKCHLISIRNDSVNRSYYLENGWD